MTWAAWCALLVTAVVLLVWPNRRAGLRRLHVGRAVGSGSATVLRWRWRAPGPDAAVGRQLAAALDLLAACLEAGAPMQTAVETVADVSAPATAEILVKVAGQLRLGRAEADAWRGLAQDHWWGPVARDVVRSARSGTSLVGSLRVHAADHRRRSAAARTKSARAVGVRSVLPLMACFLPAFVLVGVVPIIAGLVSSFFE